MPRCRIGQQWKLQGKNGLQRWTPIQRCDTRLKRFAVITTMKWWAKKRQFKKQCYTQNRPSMKLNARKISMHTLEIIWTKRSSLMVLYGDFTCKITTLRRTMITLFNQMTRKLINQKQKVPRVWLFSRPIMLCVMEYLSCAYQCPWQKSTLEITLSNQKTQDGSRWYWLGYWLWLNCQRLWWWLSWNKTITISPKDETRISLQANWTLAPLER